MKDVYITSISKFLPNQAISNDEMEHFLGLIQSEKSRVKPLILRNNGIKKRYYALTSNGEYTHSNAELTREAIKGIEEKGFDISNLDLLAVGTGSPDQLLPSHASMVHGLLKNKPMEVISPEGSCNSGMLALKYAYMSVKTESSKNAIAGGSELSSSWLQNKNFKEEANLAKLSTIENKPYVQFEKEFLRWMLSDGASVALLQNSPNLKNVSLKIDFIDITSYANELPTCMYAGGELEDNSQLKPWRRYSNKELVEKSILAVHQNTEVLGENIVKLGIKRLKEITHKYNFSVENINYFLPHMSSEFFRKKIEDEALRMGIPFPKEKWFTNLHKVGNVGAASPFLMLEELFNSGKLKKGEKILIMSPESARFSYAYVLMTVV